MAKAVTLVQPDKKSRVGIRTLPLNRIYTITPQRYKDRAKYARLLKLSTRKDKETGLPIILSVMVTTHDHNGAPKMYEPQHHYQSIQVMEASKRGKRIWNRKCKVSCSCSDFMYVDEVALFKKANSDIYFSNGELPVIKNPKMVPQICKHLVYLLEYVRKKGW